MPYSIYGRTCKNFPANMAAGIVLSLSSVLLVLEHPMAGDFYREAVAFGQLLATPLYEEGLLYRSVGQCRIGSVDHVAR